MEFVAGPSFETVLCADAPVLPLGIFEFAAENPTTAWVLVIQAIVHVVDESVVLDGVSWSPSLQDRVVGFNTELAQRILAVVTDPSPVIGLTAQPIFQHTGREVFQGLLRTTFGALISLRSIVCHFYFVLQEFTP